MRRLLAISVALAAVLLASEHIYAVPFREPPRSNEPEVVVIELKHTDAEGVADVIKQVYGGYSVTVEVLPTGNALWLRGEAPLIRDVRKVIDDMEKTAAEPPKVMIIGGGRADPAVLAALIRAIKGLPTHDNQGKAIIDGGGFAPNAEFGPRAFQGGGVFKMPGMK